MARNCQKCGGAVGEKDLYCIHCGTPLERKEAEIRREEASETAPPLSVKDYILIGILLALPVANIVLAILWATGKKGNPNRRNLARAWLIFAAVGTVLGGMFLVGLVRSVQLDRIPENWYYEYDDPEEYWEYWEYDDPEEYWEYDYEPHHHWEEILEDWGEI